MKKKGLYNSASCIGFKYNKKKRSSSKYFNKKHKLCPSCFNDCVEWTLNISFTQDKIAYSNVSTKIIIKLI